MEKINLEIQDYEDKRSKDKKTSYTRFKTNQGWMSCFDETAINALKGCEGKIVACDVAVTNKDGREFKNIKKAYGLAESVSVASEEVTEEQTSPRASVKGSAYEKDPVGLAVEIFVAMYSGFKDSFSIKEGMEDAIEAVKQAQKAFI